MKLLLIEDDVTTVESITICLNVFRPDYELTLIDNGLEVVEAVKANHFAGIIMDLGLPGLDGTLVLEELSQFSKVPIIVLTARHAEEEKTHALKLGVKEFITKPFDFHHLLNSLKAHCEGEMTSKM